MALCQNRNQIPGSPSTCSLDSFIIPFPSCLILSSPALLFAVSLQYRRSFSDSIASLTVPYYFQSDQPIDRRQSMATTVASPTSSKPRRLSYLLSLNSLIVIFVACVIGMRIDEIARLSSSGMGVGLLPLGVIAAIAVLLMVVLPGRGGRKRGVLVSAVLVSYWLLISILQMVKVGKLRRLNELFSSHEVSYPSSTYLLDNIILLVLYFFLFILESIYLIKLVRFIARTLNERNEVISLDG